MAKLVAANRQDAKSWAWDKLCYGWTVKIDEQDDGTVIVEYF